MNAPATPRPPGGTTISCASALTGIQIKRFWTKVDQSAGTERCWPWTGARQSRGYGHFKSKGRTILAHRFMYELATGELLGELEVDHICFNRSCVNPCHLRAVTHKQNHEHLRGATRVSTSGVRGVRWNEQRKRWCANVGHHGKYIYVGRFTTIEEADAAVRVKRLELFTHNNVDRQVVQ